MLSAQAQRIVDRLLRERINPAAQERDIWSVCDEVSLQLPEKLVRELASAYLADAWLKPQREDEKAPRQPYTPRKKRNPVVLSAANQATLDAELEAIDRRFWGDIGSLVNDFKAAVRREITAELLAETFELEDGTRVTWGEATHDQHRAAAVAHGAIAGEQLQAAARHEAAIDMLDESGARCLAECVPLAV